MIEVEDDTAAQLRFHVARVQVEQQVETRYTRDLGRLPTINVKCYASLSDAQFKEVRSELPKRYQRGFTRKYLKSADHDHAHYNHAAEEAWELAKEDATVVFGAYCEVHSDGRSGGWLVVHGLPSLEECPEEWTRARNYWPSDSEGWNCDGIVLTRRDTLLHRWRYYCACAAANVADMPRAHAWQIAFNKYLPEREEKHNG